MIDQERAEERRKDLVKALSFAICNIQSKKEFFKYECEQNGWNDEVISIMDEGIQKFGEALATLILWNDDISDPNK